MEHAVSDSERANILYEAAQLDLKRLADAAPDNIVAAHAAARRYVEALRRAEASADHMYDEPAHVYAPKREAGND